MRPLREIDGCFQGVIPGYLATVSAEGETNVTSISVVRLLGPTRVGLSCQFMNKSLNNLKTTGLAQVLLLCPVTLREFQLDLRYVGAISGGPVFERVDAQVSAAAAQSSMEDVFRLESVLECEVLDWRKTGTQEPQVADPGHAIDSLQLLDSVAQAIQSATDLEALLDATLHAVDEHLGLGHGFFLMAESDGQRFYNLASRGFDTPSFGAEIALGEGMYGTCAERRVAVRSGSLSRDRLMSQAVARASGQIERRLPLPGLEAAESSLAIPVTTKDTCLGVLCFQSERPAAFTDEHELMLSIVARHLAAMMNLLDPSQRPALELSGRRGRLGGRALATRVKFFESDGSVFLDENYVIKGTAGRILWSVLRTYVSESREDFSNKEIRLDPSIGLPAIKDNLEARLIALRKRLDERAVGIRIDKTSRGRFRLEVDRELVLEARD